MNSCLAESDLPDLGNEMIAGFERRVAAIPRDLCAPFHTEARQLETELLSSYKFVASSTRKEEDRGRIFEQTRGFTPRKSQTGSIRAKVELGACDDVCNRSASRQNHRWL